MYDSTQSRAETWDRGLNLVREAIQRSQNFGPRSYICLKRTLYKVHVNLADNEFIN